MKSVAFVFTQPPHGNAAGREGLDAVLAVSALTDQIALFFIGDGVLQLLDGQQPAAILARDYIATFGALPFYDVEICYICGDSLAERGLPSEIATVLPAERLVTMAWREKLDQYDIVMTF